MSDQGIWFKLWCSSVDDPSLDNLPIEDFGRWAKLGAYVKRHGTAGKLILEAPARALAGAFQVGSFETLCAAISRLPHVDITTVTCETVASVTFHNWERFQGDNSTHRVRKFRHHVTSANGGEEKRIEENRSTTTTRARLVHEGCPNDFDSFWESYPKKRSKGDALRAWKSIKPAGALLGRITAAVARFSLSRDWTKEGGRYIPYPATWLRAKGWEDQVDTVRDDGKPTYCARCRIASAEWGSDLCLSCRNRPMPKAVT